MEPTTKTEGPQATAKQLEPVDAISDRTKRLKLRQIKECFVAFDAGKKSTSSSLYVIVDSEQLDKAGDDTNAMLKAVRKCGTVYSSDLGDRMLQHRAKIQRRDVTKKKYGKETEEEQKQWENFRMLEVETKKCDSDKTSTYDISFEIYIIIMEYAVHCLKDCIPNLTSKPGFGYSASWLTWYAQSVLIDYPIILDDIKKKIIEALNEKNYVNEVFECNRCGRLMKTKSSVDSHQRTHACQTDKEYFRLLKKQCNQNSLDGNSNMLFSVQDFKYVFQQMLMYFVEFKQKTAEVKVPKKVTATDQPASNEKAEQSRAEKTQVQEASTKQEVHEKQLTIDTGSNGEGAEGNTANVKTQVQEASTKQEVHEKQLTIDTGSNGEGAEGNTANVKTQVQEASTKRVDKQERNENGAEIKEILEKKAESRPARKISVKDMIIILLQCVEKESKKNYLIEINDERLNPDTIIDKIHNNRLVVTNGDQIITIGKTTEIDFDITPEL